jgi:hypothetical protein
VPPCTIERASFRSDRLLRQKQKALESKMELTVNEDSMTIRIKQQLAQHPMFDVAILGHGFTPYMRDYDVLVEAGGIGAGRYLYRFSHCPEVKVVTKVRYDAWQESWDDLYTEYQRWIEAGEPEGFVWGTCWSMAYPGLTLHKDSEVARRWSEPLQKPMHEVTIETEAFLLQLVFHDLTIQKLSDHVSVIDRVIFPLS